MKLVKKVNVDPCRKTVCSVAQEDIPSLLFSFGIDRTPSSRSQVRPELVSTLYACSVQVFCSREHNSQIE